MRTDSRQRSIPVQCSQPNIFFTLPEHHQNCREYRQMYYHPSVSPSVSLEQLTPSWIEYDNLCREHLQPVSAALPVSPDVAVRITISFLTLFLRAAVVIR